jgi:hypothetical protein
MRITEYHGINDYVVITGSNYEMSVKMNPGESSLDTLLRVAEEYQMDLNKRYKRGTRINNAITLLKENNNEG